MFSSEDFQLREIIIWGRGEVPENVFAPRLKIPRQEDYC
jgi:hypothetical protein